MRDLLLQSENAVDRIFKFPWRKEKETCSKALHTRDRHFASKKRGHIPPYSFSTCASTSEASKPAPCSNHTTILTSTIEGHTLATYTRTDGETGFRPNTDAADRTKNKSSRFKTLLVLAHRNLGHNSKPHHKLSCKSYATLKLDAH